MDLKRLGFWLHCGSLPSPSGWPHVSTVAGWTRKDDVPGVRRPDWVLALPLTVWILTSLCLCLLACQKKRVPLGDAPSSPVVLTHGGSSGWGMPWVSSHLQPFAGCRGLQCDCPGRTKGTVTQRRAMGSPWPGRHPIYCGGGTASQMVYFSASSALPGNC